MGKRGQNNYKGINAQSWAAMSLLLQHMKYVDFDRIEFESDNLEDFTLFFSNASRLVCESKNWETAFTYSNLQDLFKALTDKGEIKDKDRILIVSNNISSELMNTIKNFNYSPDRYKQLFLKKSFKEDYFKYFRNIEFWVADFSEEEGLESTRAIFTGLLDFGITDTSLKGLFDSIIVDKVYKGSEKGNSFSREEFFKILDDFKERSIKETGRYDDEYKTIDTQLTQLVYASEQLKKAQRPDDFAPKVLEALSTKPNLMSYVLNKLEQVRGIDLDLVKPVLNLNITFRYSSQVLRILLNNIEYDNNAGVIIGYLQKKARSLFYSRKDHFWVSDYKKLASRLLELGDDHTNEIYKITRDLIYFYDNNYLFQKSNREEYEFEQLIELLGEIYKKADDGLSKDIVVLISKSFDLVGRDIDYVLRHDNALFDILHDYTLLAIDQDSIGEQIEMLTSILIEDYKDEYMGLGSSYKGYELYGSISSWSGNQYSVSDKKFIFRMLIPVLKELYEKHPSELWKYIDDKILQSETDVDNPDFLKRSVIPLLLERYFSTIKSESTSAEEHLKKFIEETKGLPSKSELIFQYLYNGEYDESKVWNLIEMYTDKYRLPYSPFVEKIVTMYLSSSNKKIKKSAKAQIEKWIYDDEYIDRALRWHGDIPSIINTLLNEFPKDGEKFFDHFVRSEWLGNMDRIDVYEYSRILHSYAQKGFSKAKERIDTILKGKMSVNQQILITSGVFSITNRDVSDEYLNQLYDEYVDPLLTRFNNDAIKISQKITHANAREVFIDIAEEIARRKAIEDRVGKALRIIKVFVHDPEPYLPGEDPEDPNAEYSSHKSILEGKSVSTISTVRGKCAWSLAVTVNDESKPYIDEIIEIADKLIDDENYYVLKMLSHLMERLGQSRLWVEKEGSTKLFWKDEKIEALKLAKRIEALAFRYLERIVELPEKAKIALVKPASLVFNHIRALNFEQSVTLLDLIGKFPDEVIYEFTAYYIFFAFYRKGAYVGWKHRSKGYYDDLDITDEQEQVYIDRLKTAISTGDRSFKLNVLHMLERVIEEGKTAIQKERAIKFVKEMLQTYDTRMFSDLYMLVEKIIGSDFETAYDLYVFGIETEYDFLKNMPDGEIDEIARLNYFYDFGVVLKSIYNTKGQVAFLGVLEKLLYYPLDMAMRNVDQIDEILTSMSTEDKKAQEVFQLLSRRYPNKYLDLYNSWKGKVRK